MAGSGWPTQATFGISPEQAYGQVASQAAMQNVYQNEQIKSQGQQNQALAKVQGGYGNTQAQIGANSNLGAAQAAAGANRYGSDTQLKAIQAQLDQKNQRFNQLFPMFQGLLGNSGGGGGGFNAAGNAGAVGNYGYGTVQAPPAAGASNSVISPAQLQSNINLNNAQNWQQAAGESRRQTQQIAGGGVGATSPLAKALQSQVFGSALQANTEGATNARNSAAQLNAANDTARYQAQLGAQAQEYGSRAAAGASQYGSQLDYQASLAGIQQQRQNAILAALAGLAG